MKANDINTSMPALMVKNIDIFICPACGGDLNISQDAHRIQCSDCHRSFKCKKGIPLLFWQNKDGSKIEITRSIRHFYEENPFPSYEDMESKWSLKEKAERGIFARLLDEQISHGVKILEVGCGTGQLSNFLGMTWGRTIFATDISFNSLLLGQEFKEKNQIENVAFIQMNIFCPVFRPDSFNLVICNGVLHHTKDPFLGFQILSKLVRKSGFIIIGLYNAYGRVPTDIRRFIIKTFGKHFKFLDSRYRNDNLSHNRKNIWFKDQYENPHESKHTIDEVLGWFDQCGIEFINSIPKSRIFEKLSPDEKLFDPNPRGTKFGHFLVQLAMVLNGGKEGGFFIMIGRKK